VYKDGLDTVKLMVATRSLALGAARRCLVFAKNDATNFTF
jgi:hypothetical protein